MVFILIIVCIIFLIKVGKEEKEEEIRAQQRKIEDDIEEKINELIEQHLEVLRRKYKQTHYIDDYGRECENGWEREVNYFIKNIIRPETRHLDMFGQYVKENADMISLNISWKCYIKNKFDNFFNEIRNAENNESGKTDIRTGVDYENFIERILQDADFEVTRTPTTGDQGVDLIAKKNGERIAIQCKFYSKAVGNKAVQEVVAGKDYYECKYACVVSNNTYTPSARKLASVSHILLLNEDDIIDRLNTLIGNTHKSSTDSTSDSEYFSEEFWKNITVNKLKSRIQSIDNINMQDKDGDTFLIHAAMNNCSINVIKTLVKLGADVNITGDAGYNALMAASSHTNNVNVIKYFIQQGVKVNAKTTDGITALMYAAGRNNNADVIKALLESGAKINAKKNDGMTALIIASNQNENAEVTKILINAGADVNAKMDNGMTALIAASKNKNADVTKILLNAGADINAQCDGETALDKAINNNNHQVVNLLRKYQSKVKKEYSYDDDDEYEYDDNNDEEEDEELFFTDLTSSDDSLKIK